MGRQSSSYVFSCCTGLSLWEDMLLGRITLAEFLCYMATALFISCLASSCPTAGQSCSSQGRLVLEKRRRRFLPLLTNFLSLLLSPSTIFLSPLPPPRQAFSLYVVRWGIGILYLALDRGSGSSICRKIGDPDPLSRR